MGSQRVAAFALFLLIVPSSQALAEEPLPVVRARGLLTTSVDLPAEPLRDDDFVTVALTDTITTPARAMETLRAAVAANDFPRFRVALTQATDLADSLPLGDGRNALRRNLLIYRDVEQLWSFARSDRFGAFFDDEALPGMRDHLAADYRGLEAFLTANRIVDRNGIELYPTSETRAYLMRLVEPSPRGVKPSLVASTTTATPKAARHHATLPRTTPYAVASKVAAKAPVAIANAAAVVAAPVVVLQAPAIVTPKTDAFAAPETVAVLPKETEAPRVQQAQIATSPSSGRGLFFIILALALLGGLMMMLRAPEAAPAIVPAPDEQQPATREDEVIPLKKAQ